MQNDFKSQSGRGEEKNSFCLPEIEIRSSSIEQTSVLTDAFPLLSFVVNLIYVTPPRVPTPALSQERLTHGHAQQHVCIMQPN
jgi:hypothetical protein